MKIQAINNFNNRVYFGNFSEDGDDTLKGARIQRQNSESAMAGNYYKRVKSGEDNFYSLPNFARTNVIYEMLSELKQDLITLSENQHKMQEFNDIGFRLTAANSASTAGLGKQSIEIMDKAADKLRIDMIG